MRRAGGLAIAIMLAPAALLAGPFDGIFRQAANAECGLVGVDGGALEIRDNVFHGVESRCEMTRPVNVDRMDAILYTLECAGEGTTWSERVMMMNAADNDDIFMIWDGYAFRYSRCPEPN
ncbi:MAG: hypothetical protein JJ872_04625 [Marivivens sp.]|jgi:hypothetical protein|nr:hypothetical protein [Marivivens sp.]